VAVWLAIEGELDIGTIAPLRDLLARLREARAEVIVDLAGVTFMDSSAINLLWDAGVPVTRAHGLPARALALVSAR
jgi:anti-anti-sigma factor